MSKKKISFPDKNTLKVTNFYNDRLLDSTKKYGSVLCISLDNIDYYTELKVNNDVTIISDMYNNINDYTYQNLTDLLNYFYYLRSMGKKFDRIIMNPPYNRNLHLKILEQAITHLKDADSICVNLSPDDWIKNPYKMFEKDTERKNARKNIAPYIKTYESFSTEEFNNLFGTSNFFGVGLISIGKTKTNFNADDFNSTNSLVIKLLEKISKLPSLRSKFSRRCNNPYFVPVRRTSNGYLNYCEFDDNEVNAKDGIQFSNDTEVLNFKNSIINTWLYRYLETTDWSGSKNSAKMPFMSDYTKPWTDADFYEFFNITSDEQRIIEDTMAKYK